MLNADNDRKFLELLDRLAEATEGIEHQLAVMNMEREESVPEVEDTSLTNEEIVSGMLARVRETQSLFPIRIQFVGSDRRMICWNVEDVPQGQSFKVIETQVQIDDPRDV